MELIGIALLWIVCGVIAYGRTFAHFQKSFPRIAKEMAVGDALFALIMAICGPAGLFISLIYGKQGMMFRAPKESSHGR